LVASDFPSLNICFAIYLNNFKDAKANLGDIFLKLYFTQ